ncbi:MAG: hypothetical protein E6J91_24915 [Deltaproteobacteria bacterium]|nr:MAG: hypothetical protein E6J91_24915 [Deltaproteobacteria bacterium]
MITQLSIRHFKAIASATIPLGPITVLVGPNDSGKSTILQALMALSRCGDPAQFSPEQLLECSPSVAARHGDKSVDIEFTVDGITTLDFDGKRHSYRYLVAVSPQRDVFSKERILWDDRQILESEPGNLIYGGNSISGQRANSTELSLQSRASSAVPASAIERSVNAIANDLSATMLRLDARAIALPAPLDAPVRPDGYGVVGIVDEWLTSGVDDERIERVNEILRRLSPHVAKMATKKHTPSGGKELYFALRTGAIPASQMSDGVVVAAALALISLKSAGQRMLIEEPENGLHPRQLRIVADTIRMIADTQGAQIILTTHSPLLLNHFTAEEVVLVTRDQSGVHVQRMSDAKGLDELASEMALGELWYNIGDSNLARPA